MTNLLVCELSEIVAAGIEVVAKQAACKVVACCRSADEVLRMAELLRPEMIFASSSALGEEVIATICRLRAENRRPKIIILIDTNPGPTAANLAEFNVDGLLLKHASSAVLLECIKSVQQGRTWLDPDLLHHLATATSTRRHPVSTFSQRASARSCIWLLWACRIRKLRAKRSCPKARLRCICIIS